LPGVVSDLPQRVLDPFRRSLALVEPLALRRDPRPQFRCVRRFCRIIGGHVAFDEHTPLGGLAAQPDMRFSLIPIIIAEPCVSERDAQGRVGLGQQVERRLLIFGTPPVRDGVDSPK
jgi:hypothetical protein